MISENGLKLLQCNINQIVNVMAATALRNEGGRRHGYLINTSKYDGILAINKSTNRQYLLLSC